MAIHTLARHLTSYLRPFRLNELPFRSGIAAFLGVIWLFPTSFSAFPADQNSYPSRQITIIVPLSAGTAIDLGARHYADALSRSLGVPVVIDNRAGANLMVGIGLAARANPDGLTLLIAPSGALVVNPMLRKQLTYDPDHDLRSIAEYAESIFVLVNKADAPAHSVSEFLTLAKERKSPLSFSSAGVGSPQHLAMELVKQQFGLAMTHVPFKSSAQAVTDVAAGQIDVAFGESGTSIPLVKSGNLRALAVSSSSRLPSLPDVPTFAEAAGMPGFEVVTRHVVLVPAGTPTPIVERLHAEFRKLSADPEMKKKIAQIGLIPDETPSIEKVGAFVSSEKDKWGRIVDNLGLRGSE